MHLFRCCKILLFILSFILSECCMICRLYDLSNHPNFTIEFHIIYFRLLVQYQVFFQVDCFFSMSQGKLSFKTTKQNRRAPIKNLDAGGLANVSPSCKPEKKKFGETIIQIFKFSILQIQRFLNITQY